MTVFGVGVPKDNLIHPATAATTRSLDPSIPGFLSTKYDAATGTRLCTSLCSATKQLPQTTILSDGLLKNVRGYRCRLQRFHLGHMARILSHGGGGSQGLPNLPHSGSKSGREGAPRDLGERWFRCFDDRRRSSGRGQSYSRDCLMTMFNCASVGTTNFQLGLVCDWANAGNIIQYLDLHLKAPRALWNSHCR